MMTIEVECPKCDVTFDVDDFDETKETEDTTCPECGAELEISEFDPTTKDYTIEDVTDPGAAAEQADLEAFGEDLEEEEDEEEEEAGLIVTEEEEDEEDDEEDEES